MNLALLLSRHALPAAAAALLAVTGPAWAQNADGAAKLPPSARKKGAKPAS